MENPKARFCDLHACSHVVVQSNYTFATKRHMEDNKHCRSYFAQSIMNTRAHKEMKRDEIVNCTVLAPSAPLFLENNE